VDIDTLARGVTLCIALLLVLAIGHKVRVLASNGARIEPVIATRGWSERVTTSVLAVVTVLEAACVVALLAAPTLGLFAVAMLLIVYAIELRRLRPDEGCACFGELFTAPDRAAAIGRNLILVAASLALGATYGVGLLEIAPLSSSTIGVVAVVAAALTAGQARGALLRSVSTNHPMSRGRGL
jgi:hypothetical protein